MTPLDPAKLAQSNPKPPFAPPYVDEDVNMASVEMGLELAESEHREAVADAYQERAGESEDRLDDIDRTLDEGGDAAPEQEAIQIKKV